MRTFFKILGAIVVLALVIVSGVYLWASISTSRAQSRIYETHSVDFPVPFPLDPAEVTALGLAPDAATKVALERAIERGRHLVNARYACIACHDANFGGGVMVDAFPIGSFLAPNVTLGTGTRTKDYTPRDWDRIVRHGVLPDGRPAVMPSEDFQLMSDQELSDMVAYVRSLPAVDKTVAPSSFGPLGKFLAATGQMHFSASVIPNHDAPHRVLPPPAEVSVEFGKHLAGVCTGCHKPDFSGGPITGGDPGWPPARNLTPDATGLAGWTYEQFDTAIRTGRRPDGTGLRLPMVLVLPFMNNATDTERRALWAYLQTLPPVVNAVEP